MAQQATEESIFSVEKNVELKSVIGVQRTFRRQFDRAKCTNIEDHIRHIVSKWIKTSSVFDTNKCVCMSQALISILTNVFMSVCRSPP